MRDGDGVLLVQTEQDFRRAVTQQVHDAFMQTAEARAGAQRNVADAQLPQEPCDGITAPLLPARIFAIDNFLHRSEEHTSELQSLMRISYAVFCLKKKKN